MFKLDSPRSERSLIEAVVSDSSPLVGRTLRQARFRSRYGAVVIAVARNGARVRGNIRDIVVHVGDTLLLEAEPMFTERHNYNRDFFLLSPLPDSNPLRFDRAAVATVTLVAMVLAAALGVATMLQAALVAAAVMVLTGCTSVEAARRSINWPVVLVIGASIGVGRAMESSGLASFLAGHVMALAGDTPFANLVAMFVLTSLFSQVISNNAAVVLMFPIALGVGAGLGVDAMPFVIGIVVAAGIAFATPIGYQTNLMVYGPGGYRFTDFLRAGLPLVLVTALVALVLIPRIWPF